MAINADGLPNAIDPVQSLKIKLLPSWTINNQAPIGLLSALAARASHHAIGPSPTDLATTFSVVLDQPVKAGTVNLDIATVAGSDGDRQVQVTIDNDGASGSVVVTRRSEQAERQQLTMELPVLGADDLLPYRGGRPGLAAAFEIRPLMSPQRGLAMAEAWIRPAQTSKKEFPLPLVLLAVDSWIDPHTLNKVRQHLTPTATQLDPERQLVRADVWVHPNAYRSTDTWWFLRSRDILQTAESWTNTSELTDPNGQILVHYSTHFTTTLQ